MGRGVGTQVQGLERFPFTKFLPPAVDGRAVVQRAVARIDAAVTACPVTVLTAPGGSGKSTALAAWVASTSSDGALWVRMASDDNEPAVAAGAMLEAGRRQLDAAFGRRLGHVLASNAAVDVGAMVTSLVNDLGDGPPVTLVLDDFHVVVEPPVLELFDVLLDHLPPGVRVLIASRTEPALSLPRRRVRGQLAELGLEELLLDRDAVRQVLALEGEITDAHVDAVLAASGGWAAAVRLATTRTGDGHVTVPDATDVAGSAARAALHRFLAEEVLDALPERLRTFLLETAVLDELDPRVCDAVTGRSDSRELLAELDRRNLFVTRHPGTDGVAWRTHDLFAEFLNEQLEARWPAEVVRSLHRHAGTVLPPMRAVPHLLAAGEHDSAAELIIHLGLSDLDSSTVVLLKPWIEAMPDEVVDRHHRLSVLHAWDDHIAGRSHEVRAALEPLRERLRAAGAHLAAAEVAAMLAEAYLQAGAIEQAGEALDELLTQPVEPWLRVTGLATRMWWCYYRDDWPGVSTNLEEAATLAVTADEPAMYKCVAPSLSSLLLFVDQGPTWFVERVERLAAGLSGADTASLTAMRPVRAGAALLHLGIDRAVTELRRCLVESAEFGRMAWKHQEAEALLMTAALGTGDLATVRKIVDDAAALFDTSPIHGLHRHVYVYAGLRALWLAGEHRELADTYRRLLAGQPSAGLSTETVARAVAEAMIARAEGRGLATLETLSEAEETQRRGRCWWWVGLPGLERASILLEDGRTAAAIEAAAPTLDTAATYGAGILVAEAQAHRAVLERCARAGIHTDLVRTVLAVIDGQDRVREPVVIPDSGESLSSREIEVLEQVATGASNRVIAEALFISEPTVKSHLTRILRKLQASSRTHAVARARELRLL